MPVTLSSVKLVNNLQSSKVTGEIALTDDLRVLIEQVNPGRASAVALKGRNWSLSHTAAQSDTAFSCKFRRRGATFTISQAIPGNNWFLVPCPAFQVQRDLAVKDGRANIAAGYNSLLHSGSIANKVYNGPNNKNKATFVLFTHQPPAFSLRSKLDSRLLQSLAVTYTALTGPLLRVKTRPSNGVKAQATAGTEDLTAAVQWRTAEKHELSAAVRWPFPISGKPSKPQCQLTGTWKF
ncbi:hypothetical protein WJX84_004943 [Apatococcus fuscideae]|uniref:Uncharacterized protein n=1 Tax=Apatococcus fuscideae TaxID=2026836 RepID=A0AAW1SZ53_9CHLO